MTLIWILTAVAWLAIVGVTLCLCALAGRADDALAAWRRTRGDDGRRAPDRYRGARTTRRSPARTV